MKIYDSLIKDICGILKDSPSHSWDFNPQKGWHDIGEHEVVLLQDTAFEMGGQGLAAANCLCVTSDEKLVGKDRVVLFGEDLNRIKQNCPFARITLASVTNIDGDEDAVYRQIKDIEFAKYRIYPEGYMMRISAENYREQVRISKKAVKAGISFEYVGNGFISEYKRNASVKNVCVIFITGNADFDKITALAKKANDMTAALCHIMDGIAANCGSCNLKELCNEVEGLKELHFKHNKKHTVN
ncbi:hypothetical protein V1L52_10945 [Treponema sp. HNW]|uniref:hypothetical protein n=1 Tax=unclassified Treponema TaxID=2638727 RepID=UPI003D0EA288